MRKSESESEYMEWTGTWLPLQPDEVAEDVLTDAAFASAATKFSCKAPVSDIHYGKRGGVDGGVPTWVQWNWPMKGGHYKMNQGEHSNTKYRDKQHQMRMWPMEPRCHALDHLLEELESVQGGSKSARISATGKGTGTGDVAVAGGNDNTQDPLEKNYKTCDLVAAVACKGHNEFGRFVSSGFVEHLAEYARFGPFSDSTLDAHSASCTGIPPESTTEEACVARRITAEQQKHEANELRGHTLTNCELRLTIARRYVEDADVRCCLTEEGQDWCQIEHILPFLCDSIMKEEEAAKVKGEDEVHMIGKRLLEQGLPYRVCVAGENKGKRKADEIS